MRIHFVFNSVKMNLSFKDKKILVIGAGRGIGRAVAVALARRGCKVYPLIRTQEDLHSLVEENPCAKSFTTDVSNWYETTNVIERFEPFDGLVNNTVIVLSGFKNPKERH